jgi:negative regulator of genetic competence, sporulation and motility
MFTNISWGNYIVVIILLLASWYLFVGFRFYFDDLKEVISGKRRLQFRGFENAAYQDTEPELKDQESAELTSNQTSFGEFDTTFQDVDDLVARIKSFITDAAKKKLVKKEFTYYLQLLLREFPSVKNSPFNSSVSELIVSECDKIESITLTQKEAEALWE